MTHDETRTREVLAEHLAEAFTTERRLTSVLRGQIAATPRGAYRNALETHLRETRDHAERVAARIEEVAPDGGGLPNPLELGARTAQTVLSQVTTLSRVPLDLVRGAGGDPRVLRNAFDAAASEALEIAQYTAIEALARRAGDEQTAELAASILADERRMLDRVLGVIPRLATAELEGDGRADLATTGAADTLRALRTPAPESADDLPIPDYDDRNAEEIVRRLGDLSQDELTAVDGYERAGRDRTTIRERIAALRGDEPLPGYDAMTAAEIRAALADAEPEQAAAVERYERAHKKRSTVLDATRREATAAR
jgi:ferritin-like metal-binding protein YciE